MFPRLKPPPLTKKRRAELVGFLCVTAVAVKAILYLALPGSRWEDSFVHGAVFVVAGPATLALQAVMPPPDVPGSPHRIAEENAIALLRVWDDSPFSRSLLENFVEHHGEEEPNLTASVLARLGRADDAFRWLGKARSDDDPRLSELKIDPLFAAIHNDLRWRQFSKISA